MKMAKMTNFGGTTVSDISYSNLVILNGTNNVYDSIKTYPR